MNPSSKDRSLNQPASSMVKRCQQARELSVQWCPEWFNAEGEWIYTTEKPATHTRSVLWLCFGLLAGPESSIALANSILAKLEFRLHVKPRSESEVQSPFDIFVTNHTIQMLVLHGGKLKDEVREKLEGWARSGLNDFPGDRQADYQFHGFNDNMPAKASLGMILGGEYFNDPAAVEHGLWNLRRLGDLLSRRGLLSEYTSPTYSPLTLLNLAEISLHARNSEARELAAKAVERIWADILGHFHWPTGLMGGPYSRAYQADRTGHLSTMNYVLWLTLGDAVIPNPLEEITREPMRLNHHHNFRPDAVGLMGWMGSCELPPPDYLVEWSKTRGFPFRLQASAERGVGLPNFRACEPVSTHYQEEDFAMGSALDESWTDGFFLQYRRHAPARKIEDVRTAYTSYYVDGEGPDDEHSQRNSLKMTALQEGRTMLLLARPKLDLSTRAVSKLRLAFVLPNHFGEIEQIEERDNHVFVRDGRVYLALRALNVSDWGGDQAIKIEPVAGYQQISFYNYEGEPRMFTREELARTLNGFAMTVGLTGEESFDAFQNRVLAASYVDYWHFGMRTVRYGLGTTLLEMSYSPEGEAVRYASVNGRPQARPIWQASGLPAERLPFLDGTWTPEKPTIPYQHLKVIWAPDAPWVIASDGRGGSSSGGEGWRKWVS